MRRRLRRILARGIEGDFVRGMCMDGNGDSPKVARVMVAVISGGFFVASVVATSANRDGFPHLAVATTILVATLGLHLLHSGPASVRRRRPWWPWSLVAHGLLTFVPYLFFQDTWVGIPGSFAAAVLLTIPVPQAWVAFTALIVLQAPLVIALGDSAVQGVNSAVSHVVGGLALFGVVRLADLAEELQAARAELALRAVERERLRFARDLHDLCGYSLTAVALQCEQIRWLVRSDPRRAEEELGHTQTLARQALSEVRVVSAGYRKLSLEREARTAAALLESLGVTVEVDLADGELPGPADETLAIVVREGVTNALRHSKARHCVIRLTPDVPGVRLEVFNDGVSSGPVVGDQLGRRSATDPGGSGIRNLRERVVEHEGTLLAEVDGSGGFRLVVTLPCGLHRGLSEESSAASVHTVREVPDSRVTVMPDGDRATG